MFLTTRTGAARYVILILLELVVLCQASCLARGVYRRSCMELSRLRFWVWNGLAPDCKRALWPTLEAGTVGDTATRSGVADRNALSYYYANIMKMRYLAQTAQERKQNGLEVRMSSLSFTKTCQFTLAFSICLLDLCACVSNTRAPEDAAVTESENGAGGSGGARGPTGGAVGSRWQCVLHPT